MRLKQAMLLLLVLGLLTSRQALAFYNASTGRWLSRDSIGEEGGINLHSFVVNTLVHLFDLFGLKDIEIGGPSKIVALDKTFSGLRDRAAYTVPNREGLWLDWWIRDTRKIRFIDASPYSQSTRKGTICVTPTAPSGVPEDTTLEVAWRGRIIGSKKITVLRPKRVTRNTLTPGTLRANPGGLGWRASVNVPLTIWDQLGSRLPGVLVEESVATISNVDVIDYDPNPITGKKRTDANGQVPDLHSAVFINAYREGISGRTVSQQIKVGSWLTTVVGTLRPTGGSGSREASFEDSAGGEAEFH